MKITTLNLRHGGGQRIDLCLGYLVSTQSDVLVLTEFRNNQNGIKLKQHLKDHGFNFFFSPTEDSNNSILIATRTNAYLDSIKDLTENDKHRACLVTVDGLKIMGVYFPQKNEKQTLFKTILDDNNELLKQKSLIIGDFNTGLPFQDESKESFYCVKEFYRLNEVGFIDAWRSRHPDKFEFSWFSKADNGFRIDHAFVTESFNSLISSVEYDHFPRNKKITDHSALLIDLNY